MSHITLAQQGMAAVENRSWDEALHKLSVALEQSANPGWLIGRSKALVAVSRFREALDDADLAWHSAYERNKRDLMIEAHYRRAVAYFRLGEFANADCCCLYAMRLAKGKPAVERGDPVAELRGEGGRWAVTAQQVKDETAADDFGRPSDASSLAEATQAAGEAVKQWRRATAFRLQAVSRMEKLPADDDKGRVATAALKPPKKALANLAKDEKKPEKSPQASPATATAAAAVPAVTRPQVPADTPVRLQDFQNDSTMSVTIFSKGVSKDKLQVEFLPRSVRLDPIIYPSGDERAFTLSLWGEIDTAASKYTVTPSKVELSLKKKSPGKWPQLKGEGADSEPSADEKLAEAKEKEVLEHLKESRKKAIDEASGEKEAPEPEQKQKQVEESAATKAPEKGAASGPSYPTSSKGGAKNWDQIADADSDNEESDGVNVFFKKLYKNATPEQQRAMMKSFTESNGTSLSTDWNDVKGRKVETVPPEGVEAKKW